MTKTQHLDLLKQAIAANLAARDHHDATKTQPPASLKIISAADLMATSHDQLYLEALIQDPVRKALRDQLHDLGQRLFNLTGTTKAMLAIAEESATSSRHLTIIDKAWDTIGSKSDFWAA